MSGQIPSGLPPLENPQKQSWPPTTKRIISCWCKPKWFQNQFCKKSGARKLLARLMRGLAVL